MNTQAIPNAEYDLQPIPDWPAQRAGRPVAMKEASMTHHIDWTALYAALSEPFEPSLIRYRAGATNRDKTQALALPYVDPRAYEDRLNALVPGNWEVTFEPWGNDRIICRLSIHGVTRSSTGEAGDSPEGIAGTSAEAQAFKRACAKFGLGRHLYATTPRWMPYDATRKAVVPPTPQTQHSAGTTRPNEGRGIGRERAAAMAEALESAGVAGAHQLSFAARSINRNVHDLANLTDDEARAVWRAAASSRTRMATNEVFEPSAPRSRS